MDKLIIDKDKVLVERISSWEETTPSGIVIFKTEDSEDGKMERGKVISVGPEVEDVQLDWVVGFRQYTGKSLIFNDKECVIIREAEIDGVWE